LASENLYVRLGHGTRSGLRQVCVVHVTFQRIDADVTSLAEPSASIKKKTVCVSPCMYVCKCVRKLCVSLCFLKLIVGSHGLLPYEANRDHTLFELVVMMSDTTSEVLQKRPYAFSC